MRSTSAVRGQLSTTSRTTIGWCRECRRGAEERVRLAALNIDLDDRNGGRAEIDIVDRTVLTRRRVAVGSSSRWHTRRCVKACCRCCRTGRAIRWSPLIGRSRPPSAVPRERRDRWCSRCGSTRSFRDRARSSTPLTTNAVSSFRRRAAGRTHHDARRYRARCSRRGGDRR